MKFFTTVLRWLLGFAAFCHAMFAFFAIFSPDQLAMLTGIGLIAFSYIWVAHAGMLMFLIAMLSVPALYHPTKFRVYVWILSFGTLLEGIFWYRASHDTNGAVFAPIATFWLVVGTAEVLIVLLLAERKVRLSFHNFVEVLDECCEAADEKNSFLRLFGIVVIAQVVLSLFPIYAHLYDPGRLSFPIGKGVLFHSDVWLRLSGIEMLVLMALLVPTGFIPTRFWSYCWLTILTAVIPAICWTYVARQPLHRGFILYALVNFFFAVAMFVPFQIGAPKEKKFSPDNYQRFLSFASDRLALHGQPVWLRSIALCLFFAAVIVTGTLWYYFIRRVPDLDYGSDELQLKYGAIGLSLETRVPVYLFEALPEVFPELIPPQGGTVGSPMARFAKGVGAFVVNEDGVETPVGFSQREIGFKTVEPNCGLCHVSQIYLTKDDYDHQRNARIVYGAPNVSLDIQAYQWFLYKAATSPKFNTPTLMAAIEKKHHLGWLDWLFYRVAIIPASRNLLLQLRDDYTWQYAHNRAVQGRGRTDTFNTTKLGIMRLKDDGTTGTTDLPQVWQLGRRHYKKMYLHWDGNNPSIPERNYTAAMAVGASPDSVLPDAFDRLIRYFWTLRPAPYPLTINVALAAQGKTIFIQYCADCHAWSGNKIGQTTGSVETDENRAITFTTAHCNEFKKISYPPFTFPNYRKHRLPQYVNVPLDGLWTRAPYLHHGAVPTLRDLLKKAKDRPIAFYRGYNVFDDKNVGFVSDIHDADAQKYGTLYDTTLPGNCNSGHEFGTDLPDREKDALIEYLKTDDPLISGSDIPIPPIDLTVTEPLQPCEQQEPFVASCNSKSRQ